MDGVGVGGTDLIGRGAFFKMPPRVGAMILAEAAGLGAIGTLTRKFIGLGVRVGMCLL